MAKNKIMRALNAIGLILSVGLPGILIGMALWYRAPGPGWLAAALWAGYILGTLYYSFRSNHRPLATGLFMIVLAGTVMWWTSISAQNYKYWKPEVAHIASGDVNGSIATINHVRNFKWRTPVDYDVKWEKRSYDLDTITSVDLFLSYWGFESIAHTLVSFGFANGDHVVFSVEIRKEENEEYSNVAGFFKEYELALIAADERDIIYLRTHARGEDVYRFPIDMPVQARKDLFLSYLQTGNDLKQTPRFYNTLTANCTTLAFDMARALSPTLPMDSRIILSGYLPEYLHDHIAPYNTQPIETIRHNARISHRGQAIGYSDNFSKLLRQ